MRPNTVSVSTLKRAFTLVEVMAVMVIMGIATLVFLNRTKRVNPDASDAKTASALINSGRISLIKKTTTASALWDGSKGSPDSLITMLKANECMEPNEACTIPDTYKVVIGTVREPVSVEPK